MPLSLNKDKMAYGAANANDPDAPENIDAWTERSGDRILRIENEGDTYIIYLKKKR